MTTKIVQQTKIIHIPSGGLMAGIGYYGMLGMCCVVIANRQQYVGAQQCMEFVFYKERHKWLPIRNRWVFGKEIPY